MIYGTINFAAKRELGITNNEALFCDIVDTLSNSSAGWSFYTNEEYGALLEMTERSARRLKSKLVNEGLLVKKSPRSLALKTSGKWKDCILKYRQHNQLKDGFVLSEEKPQRTPASPLKDTSVPPQRTPASPLKDTSVPQIEINKLSNNPETNTPDLSGFEKGGEQNVNSKPKKEERKKETGHEKKKEEKRPAVKCAATGTPIDNWTGQYFDVFKQNYFDLVGVEYIIEGNRIRGKEFGSLPGLRKKIIKAYNNKAKQLPTFAEELETLDFLIRAGWEADTFLRKNLSLSLLSSRFNQTINQIKNNRHNGTTNQIGTIEEHYQFAQEFIANSNGVNP